MFPISDDNSDRRTIPVVNITFIVINILVFVFFQGLGGNDRFTYAFSTVPREITTGTDISGPQPITDSQGRPMRDERGRIAAIDLQPTPGSVYLTLLTSMFMHGSIMHIFGNMLFLWIFGDNIEDKIGKLRYGIFYITCGIIAGLSHVFMNTDSIIPSLGASGAISGVLGGYLLLFPKRRVTVIMFRFLTEVPAIVAIGMWFAFQLIEGWINRSASGGGVAYAAHIGGFLAGLILIKPFALGKE
jgi:membrane associated rhomboid family serine protease